MLHACIDIGSNTTRLLVADATDGHLKEALQQRTFTRISEGRKRDDPIGAAKIAEVAGVVATQVRVAKQMGAAGLRAVATAAIRQAANGTELIEAIHDASGVAVDVLGGDEEARLAFLGATTTLGHIPQGEVAVVFVGGGSSEVAFARLEDGVRWRASFRVGWGSVVAACQHSAPAEIGGVHAVGEHVGG